MIEAALFVSGCIVGGFALLEFIRLNNQGRMKMMNFLIGLAIGLLVGWVVLPAPAFVQKFWADYGWAKK